MLSAAVQIAMIGWDRTLRFIRGHWMIGVFIGVVTLAVLQLALTGGLVGYMVNEVIFNSYGGNNRIAIWQYGSAEVLRHPLFGIGLGDWVRPFWQHATVDNFWLLIAMRHGLPAFVFLALAIGSAGCRIMTPDRARSEETRYRTGYLIALGRPGDVARHRARLAGARRSSSWPISAPESGSTPGREAARDTRHWRAAPRRSGAGRPARPARRATAPGAARKPAPPSRPRRQRRAAARDRAAARPARRPTTIRPEAGDGFPMFETFRKLIDLHDAPGEAPLLPAARHDHGDGPGRDGQRRLDPALPRGARPIPAIIETNDRLARGLRGPRLRQTTRAS